MRAGPVDVVIPYFRQAKRITEAVESVVGQTTAVRTVLVISDGDRAVPTERLVAIDRAKVFVHLLPRNRGHFFAREVAARALSPGWVAFLDADDFVEPTWVEVLLDEALRHDGAAFCAARQISSYGPFDRTRNLSTIRPERAALDTPRQFARHTTLYHTDRIAAAGGFDPSFRIGYDTLFVNFVALTGPFGVVQEALYVRRKYDRFAREKSLTTSRETGKGSRQRREVLERVDEMYRKFAPLFRADPVAARHELLSARDIELDREAQTEADSLRVALMGWRSHDGA